MIQIQRLTFLVAIFLALGATTTSFAKDTRPEIFKQAEFLIHFNVDSAANLIKHLTSTTDIENNYKLKLEVEYLNVNLLFAQGSFTNKMII